MQVHCLLFQLLTASDVQLIASSLEHHPRLRELTVGGYDMESSFVKAAVEGIARRHCVEKLVVTHFGEGCVSSALSFHCIQCHSVLNDAPNMLHILL